MALTTISISAGGIWSRSFHERAIWRAWARSRSETGGGLIGIPNSTTGTCRNLHHLSLFSYAFRFPDSAFCQRKRMVMTLSSSQPGVRSDERYTFALSKLAAIGNANAVLLV